MHPVAPETPKPDPHHTESTALLPSSPPLPGQWNETSALGHLSALTVSKGDGADGPARGATRTGRRDSTLTNSLLSQKDFHECYF